jgi:rubrerythrin
MENTIDIIKLAIENEIRAKTFYSKAAKITSEGEASMVFLELTEMEDQHAQLLVDRFGDLLAQQDIDAQAHLAQLEESMLKHLGDQENELITSKDMRAVLEFAIQMEARARDLYHSLGQSVTDPQHRALCEDLAAEEQKHFDLLSKERLNVDMPLDERPAL